MNRTQIADAFASQSKPRGRAIRAAIAGSK